MNYWIPAVDSMNGSETTSMFLCLFFLSNIFRQTLRTHERLLSLFFSTPLIQTFYRVLLRSESRTVIRSLHESRNHLTLVGAPKDQ